MTSIPKIKTTYIRYGVLIRLRNKYWPPRLASDESGGPFAVRHRKDALEFADRLAEEFARGDRSVNVERRLIRVVKLSMTTEVLGNY